MRNFQRLEFQNRAVYSLHAVAIGDSFKITDARIEFLPLKFHLRTFIDQTQHHRIGHGIIPAGLTDQLLLAELLQDRRLQTRSRKPVIHATVKRGSRFQFYISGIRGPAISELNSHPYLFHRRTDLRDMQGIHRRSDRRAIYPPDKPAGRCRINRIAGFIPGIYIHGTILSDDNRGWQIDIRSVDGHGQGIAGLAPFVIRLHDIFRFYGRSNQRCSAGLSPDNTVSRPGIVHIRCRHTG